MIALAAACNPDFPESFGSRNQVPGIGSHDQQTLEADEFVFGEDFVNLPTEGGGVVKIMDENRLFDHKFEKITKRTIFCDKSAGRSGPGRVRQWLQTDHQAKAVRRMKRAELLPGCPALGFG